MYHHVCPADLVPQHSSALEGWQYCLSPQQFRRQLTQVRLRGWRFVSLSSYLTGLRDGTAQRQRLAAVTFDDGWRDNYEFAVPVLVEQQVPATIFVVSGAMEGSVPIDECQCRNYGNLRTVKLQLERTAKRIPV